MRGLHPRKEPLTRLASSDAEPPSPTRGEGKKALVIAALRLVGAFLPAGFEQEPGAALSLVDEGL
jgi:hypothetical protein